MAKNKSLSSLVTNKGNSSSGGTLSDKFKEKMTRTKEKFDPLNMVSSMVGKKNSSNKNNKSGSGGLLGASNGLFGDYQGKGKNKKDPRRTTIGKGPIKALKVGDSTADILAKMYNFMQKAHEVALRNYEIDNKFRQEQLEEDERRHKKLIESLVKPKAKKVEPVKKEEKKQEEGEPSWIDKMFGAMKKSLGLILSPFIALGKLLTGLLGIIPALSTIGGLVTGLLGSLTGIIVTTVMGLLSTTSVFGFLLRSFVGAVIGGLTSGMSPINKLLAVLGIAGYVGSEINRMNNEARFGEQVNKELENARKERELAERELGEAQKAFEKTKVKPYPKNGTELQQKAWNAQYGETYDPETGKPLLQDTIKANAKIEEKLKKAQEKYDKIFDELNKKIEDDFEKLKPNLETLGYEVESKNYDDRGLVYYKLKNKYTGASMTTKDDFSGMAVARGMKNVGEVIDKNITEPIKDWSGHYIKPLQNTYDEMKLQLPKLLEEYSGNGTEISMNNTTTTIASRENDIQDGSSLSVRNLNSKINQVLRNTAVV